MKVRASVKKICDKCQIITRRGKTGTPKKIVKCTNPRHKQRQG